MQAMLLQEQLVGSERVVGAWVDPHRVDPEDADGALVDQPARSLGAEARIMELTGGVRVQVRGRVVPPVLEAGPHDDGAAGRDRAEGRLPPPDLRDAEGEIGVTAGCGPYIKHDREAEEIAGI